MLLLKAKAIDSLKKIVRLEKVKRNRMGWAFVGSAQYKKDTLTSKSFVVTNN